MIRKNCYSSTNIFTALAGLIILISGCTASPTVTPSLTFISTLTSTPTFTPTYPSTPSVTRTFTATPTPFPALTLKPGNFYFSVDGMQSFIFDHNIAGYQQSHYETILDWTKSGGSKFVRIQLDNIGGIGFTRTGEVDSNWIAQWDRIIDRAEADGIYVLPVFSTWYDWNDGQGYSAWKDSAVNHANGGPVKSPAELFQKGSAAQTLWMNWIKAIVNHWHGRKNILAWEIFSEVNLASGSTETTGIDFVNTTAALIRSTDPGRPVTASIADCPPGSGACYWPNFYKQTNIDFVEMHPYLPQLDRTLISDVRKRLATYGRPVLIGESGLSAATPDIEAGKLTVAKNAPIGIRHAIWAAIVSGAMNGRALWWEDGYGIYFPSLNIPWMQEYKTVELPAVKFVNGIDFSGFKPLTTANSSAIWGAAVGNEKYIIGWFRDAACEPPDWNLKPLLSGQTVTITVSGSATDWQIDFYDTKTGTKIISSTTITRKGSMVIIKLPDFTDAIALKMFIQK
jgi:hypothetical protein